MTPRLHPSLWIAALALTWPATARAVEPAKPDPMTGHGGVASVDASAGTASYSLPIDLPEYQGLTPRLALSYSSSGGNGFAGVGWSLSGFGGQIVRGAPSRWGSPSFSADDTFSLDGALLIPCSALNASVPSCEVDGDDPDDDHVYYATQIESYQAIYYERGASGGWGVWHVLRKDGARARYTPSLVIGASAPHDAYNWVVSEVSDLNGYKVRYDWSQHLGGCCNEYPHSIHYYYPGLGYRRVAQIWWRPRTDLENTQLPNNSRQTSAAIRTIAVYDPSGAPRRAYALAYGESAATERLLLTQVQIYGRDFTLQNAADVMDGRVVGGTPLVASRPAHTFGYLADPAARSFTGGLASQALCAPGYTRGFGDFNGDGKVDLSCRRANYPQDTLRVALGTGPASFGPLQTWAHDWCNNGDASAVAADFNGDGKDDFACIGAKWDGIAVAYSDGATLHSPVWNGGWCPQGDTWSSSAFLGDFNGDGLTDHACAGFYGMKVSLATGVGFAAATDWTPPDLGVIDSPGTGDFNGDGATDLFTWRVGDGRVHIHVYLSNGADRFKRTADDWNVAAPAGQGDRGFCSINGAGGPTHWNKQIHTGDFNGDGKTDILCFNAQPDTYGHGEAQVSLSRGDRPGPASAWNQPWCGNQSNQVFTTAEVNGDGRTDIVCLNKIDFQGLPQGVSVATSAATRFSAAAMWRTGWCQDLPIQPGDFNNDGKGDLLCLGADNQAKIAFSGGDHGITAAPGTTDLLETITGPLGGVTTLGYVPSSRWPGAVGKVPLTQTLRELRTSDGVSGQTSSTLYTYEGAKYDRVERRPLGFYKVTAEAPRVAGDLGAARPRTETIYAQDYGSLTKALWAGSYDGAGNLVTVESFAYVLGSAGSGRNTVYTSLLGGSWSTTCLAGQPGCLDARTTHVGRCVEGQSGCTSTAGYYDKYGNLLQSVDYGDVSVAAVKTTCTSYAAPLDKTTYLRDRARTSTVRAGVGCGGARLSETTSTYDGRGDALAARGNLTRVTGLLAGAHVTTSTITRDAYGNTIATANGLGLTTAMELDAYGRVQKITTPTGRATTTVFDANFGRPTSVTEAGLTTTSSYDVHGRVSRITSPAGSPIDFTYAALGEPAQQYSETRTPSPAGALQSSWRRSYTDGLGRSYASRAVAAAPPSQTDVEAGTVVERSLYDARGNSVDASFPHVFGKAGAATTRTTHDALNRPLVTTLGDGATTITRAYDAAPFGVWSTAITDPLGHTNYETSGYYAGAEGQGKFEKICEYVESFGCPGGCYVCRNHYRDLLGNLVRVNYAGVYDTDTHTYDSLGRLTSAWNVATGRTDSRYDLAGRLVRTKDARGTLACLSYDDDGRPTRSQVTPGVAASIDAAACTGGGTSPTEEVLFAYDEAVPPGLAGCGLMFNQGKQTSVTAGKIVRSFGYDRTGQISCVALAVDGYLFTKKFTHDAQGRLTALTYPDGDTLTLFYDNAGRPSGIAAPERVIVRTPASQSQQGGAVGWSGAPFWQYDAAGALQYFESGNGVRNAITRSATRRWISGVDVTGPGGASLVSYGYDAARGGARDPSGRILKIASTNKAKTPGGLVLTDAAANITYDPQHRVMTAQSPPAGPGEAAWALDMVYTANGNVVRRSYTVGGAPHGKFNGTFCYPAAPGNVYAVSRVIHAGGSCASDPSLANFGYDAGGNMVSYDSKDQNLTIDRFGRLQHSDGPGPALTYTYDGGGARVKVQGASGTTYYFDDFEWTPGVGARKSVHFGNRVVAVRASAWSASSKDPPPPIATTYAHTNNIGSVVLLTDAGGAAQQRLIYSPWGERMATASAQGVAEAPRSPRRYTGEVEDESGLVFLTARYYDPRLSRFIAPDSILPTARLAGLNRYAYVENDPFAFRDPTGHAAKSEDGGGVGKKKSTTTTTTPAATNTQTHQPDAQGVALGLNDLIGQTTSAVEQLIFADYAQERTNDRLKALAGGSPNAVTNKPAESPEMTGAGKLASAAVGVGVLAHGAQLLNGVQQRDYVNIVSGGGGLVQDTLAIAKLAGDSGVSMKVLTAARVDKIAKPLTVVIGALETTAAFAQGYENGGVPGGLALAAPAAGGAIESIKLATVVAAGGPAAAVALTVQVSEMAYGTVAAATGVGGPTTLGEMAGMFGVIAATPGGLQQLGAAVVNDFKTGNNIFGALFGGGNK